MEHTPKKRRRAAAAHRSELSSERLSTAAPPKCSTCGICRPCTKLQLLHTIIQIAKARNFSGVITKPVSEKYHLSGHGLCALAAARLAGVQRSLAIYPASAVLYQPWRPNSQQQPGRHMRQLKQLHAAGVSLQCKQQMGAPGCRTPAWRPCNRSAAPPSAAQQLDALSLLVAASQADQMNDCLSRNSVVRIARKTVAAAREYRPDRTSKHSAVSGAETVRKRVWCRGFEAPASPRVLRAVPCAPGPLPVPR